MIRVVISTVCVCVGVGVGVPWPRGGATIACSDGVWGGMNIFISGYTVYAGYVVQQCWLSLKIWSYVRQMCGWQTLARQKYWQIRTNFTTLLLYNYNLKLDYKDYSKNFLVSLNCLASL